MSVAINIERKFVPYTISTDRARIRDHHDALFDGVQKPLCIAMEKLHGTAVPGCEDAAAFTKWVVSVRYLGMQKSLPSLRFRVAENETRSKADGLYDSLGAKRDVSIDCTIMTVLPQWDKITEASTKVRAEVRRFELRLAYHEHGHGLACEHLAQSIKRFLDNMPHRVPVTRVADYNAAVQKVVVNFYTAMARKADLAYDEITGHGLTQGAEAQDAV